MSSRLWAKLLSSERLEVDREQAKAALANVSQVFAAIAITKELYASIKSAQAKAKARRQYSISVDGDDRIYADVHTWLLGILPDEDRRSLVAKTSEQYLHDWRDDCRVKRKLRLAYDGTRTHVVKLDGHEVTVAVEQPEQAAGNERNSIRPKEKIVFTAASAAGRDAVIRKLEAVLKAKDAEAHEPCLHILDTYGDWTNRDDLPPRSIDSVILRKGQMEALITDLERFLAAEDAYNHRSIPWHRGLVLEGPPGTGKTSLTKALAHHFRLDLYYLPLGDIERDVKLLNVVRKVQPRSMLLLEDIDVFHAATLRDDRFAGVSLSGLLNSLDGIATPHGLITVMTTNDLSVIDPALIRPGRVDRVEHVGYADIDQLRRLFELFYPGERLGRVVGVRKDLSTAEVVEVFKRHLDDPKGARHDLTALVREKSANRP